MTSNIFEDLHIHQGSLRWSGPSFIALRKPCSFFSLKEQGYWMGIKQQARLSEETGWDEEMQNFSKHWLIPWQWVVKLVGYKICMNVQCFVLCFFQIKGLFQRFWPWLWLETSSPQVSGFKILIQGLEVSWQCWCWLWDELLYYKKKVTLLWPCTEAGSQKGILKSKEPFILGFTCRNVLLISKI